QTLVVVEAGDTAAIIGQGAQGIGILQPVLLQLLTGHEGFDADNVMGIRLEPDADFLPAGVGCQAGEEYRGIGRVTGRGTTPRHRIDLVVTAAAVNGVVEQHIAVGLKRDAPDQAVEWATIEIKGTLAWSFAEPELVVQL